MEDKGEELGMQLADLHRAEALVASRVDAKDWVSCFPRSSSPYQLASVFELESETDRYLLVCADGSVHHGSQFC